MLAVIIIMVFVRPMLVNIHTYTYHPWSEQSQRPQFWVSQGWTSLEVSPGGQGHCA